MMTSNHALGWSAGISKLGRVRRITPIMGFYLGRFLIFAEDLTENKKSSSTKKFSRGNKFKIIIFLIMLRSEQASWFSLPFEVNQKRVHSRKSVSYENDYCYCFLRDATSFVCA